MESEELKAISYIRRCLLRKNQKIRDLIDKVGNLEQRLETAESENSRMKEYEWRCVDLEKEVQQLQEELRLDMSDVRNRNQITQSCNLNDSEYNCSDSAHVRRKHPYDGAQLHKGSKTKQYVFERQSSEVPICKQENASSSSSSILSSTHGGENKGSTKRRHTEIISEEENIEHQNETLTFKYAQSSGAVFPYLESTPENFVMDFADDHCDSDCNIPGDNITSVHVACSNSAFASKHQRLSSRESGPAAGTDAPTESNSTSSLPQKAPPPLGHKCPYPDCPAVLAQRRNLADHIRHKHTLEKPFGCPLCSYRSAQTSNLNRHVRTVHHIPFHASKSSAVVAGNGSLALTAPAAEGQYLGDGVPVDGGDGRGPGICTPTRTEQLSGHAGTHKPNTDSPDPLSPLEDPLLSSDDGGSDERSKPNANSFSHRNS